MNISFGIFIPSYYSAIASQLSPGFRQVSFSWSSSWKSDPFAEVMYGSEKENHENKLKSTQTLQRYISNGDLRAWRTVNSSVDKDGHLHCCRSLLHPYNRIPVQCLDSTLSALHPLSWLNVPVLHECYKHAFEELHRSLDPLVSTDISMLWPITQRNLSWTHRTQNRYICKHVISDVQICTLTWFTLQNMYVICFLDCINDRHVCICVPRVHVSPILRFLYDMNTVTTLR